MVLVITDIKWDLEDEDLTKEDIENLNLPENIRLENPDEELLEDVDGYADNICDWLSDEYGFFVKGFHTDIEV